MAKKKNNNNKGKQQYISPERFMREKARTLPLGKCYIAPPNWQEAGLTNVIITRVRPSGNLVMTCFLVDTFCLGVKNAAYDNNMTPNRFEEYIERFHDEMGIKEITYEEAHNLIYGAIAFAEEAGIKPAKYFVPACYNLEEDTDEIPLIEYEFGKDGKYVLVVSPDKKEMTHFNTLKETLGDDFQYIMPYDDFFSNDFEENDEDEDFDPLENIDEETLKKAIAKMSDWQKESERNPDEEYSYQYPLYPQMLSVKHQFLVSELYSPDNYSALPDEVVKHILSLPPDEIAEDLSQIILFTIGITYPGINDDTIESLEHCAIMHSLILLAQIGNEKALDSVLEIMRQNLFFTDFHLGDLASELLMNALYACGKNNIAKIEEFLFQKGVNSYHRSTVAEVLAMIVYNHPERRKEIIEIFRKLLVHMKSNLPERIASDGTFAGFVMGDLMDIKASELIPEIKEVFSTGCVNRFISGDCKAVIKDIKSAEVSPLTDKYILPDIFEQYGELRKIIKKPEKD